MTQHKSLSVYYSRKGSTVARADNEVMSWLKKLDLIK